MVKCYLIMGKSLDFYLQHYLAMPDVILMVLVTLVVFALMHLIIKLYSRSSKGDLIGHFEMYYEMIISSTAMLLFIALYFLVDYRYFNFDNAFYETWNEYNDFILLFMLIGAVALMNIVDTIFIPLIKIDPQKKATLRMMAMIYMLFVFAYIKFIYGNDNYDNIIIYFLLMVIGRFAYFDASFKDFLNSMKNLFFAVPVLLLALATTGALAAYGFGTGYLLKSNGVVGSLFIAHLFLTIEIAIMNIFEKIYLIKNNDDSAKRSSRKVAKKDHRNVRPGVPDKNMTRTNRQQKERRQNGVHKSSNRA